MRPVLLPPDIMLSGECHYYCIPCGGGIEDASAGEAVRENE